MTDTMDKERGYAAMALVGGDVWRQAAKACADQMTALVMHPTTSPDDRAAALAEYHAITRLNSYVERWADDARRDIEHG
jgi:hypothetical protein